MKKYDIVFLDVDGVLNSRWELFCVQERNRRLYEKTGKDYLDATEYHIEVLEKLCKFNKDIRFVVPSTWRFDNCSKWFSKEFKRLGSSIACNRFIGETCNLFESEYEGIEHRRRGYEIQEWLQNNESWKRFVILDDDSDMEHLIEYLYLLDNRIGIHMLDIPNITRLLKQQKVERTRNLIQSFRVIRKT